MKWKSTPISEIINRDIIYFDIDNSSICERICKCLYIDSFPDISSLSYWQIVKGNWEKKKIEYSLDEDIDAFETEMLDLIEDNTSRIAYTTKDNRIDGILHFTDYESPVIYSNIYQNLNAFERHLREYLIYHGLNDKKFLEYLEAFKLPSVNPRYQEKIYDRIFKLKKQKDKRPFDNVYLSELLEFSISDYVNLGLKKDIGLDFLNEKNGRDPVYKTINSLRNFIMHHDNITGEVIFNPQYFTEFKNFFEMVVAFKKAFLQLSERLFEIDTKNKIVFNKSRLELIDRLTDEQLADYFFNLD